MTSSLQDILAHCAHSGLKYYTLGEFLMKGIEGVERWSSALWPDRHYHSKQSLVWKYERYLIGPTLVNLPMRQKERAALMVTVTVRDKVLWRIWEKRQMRQELALAGAPTVSSINVSNPWIIVGSENGSSTKNLTAPMDRRVTHHVNNCARRHARRGECTEYLDLANVPQLRKDLYKIESERLRACGSQGYGCRSLKHLVYCHWSKPENHHITYQPLSLIGDSPLWNSAVFGFDKGTSGSVVATGKGKNDLQHR
ncbi:hypothetical protein M405DRAFT_880923 [Rhizopogon salebrosus TDB-379]|nr:hypothetical protein M405DRAFT_880923 [Rhizopogon salebrosus TDB-379]